MKQCLICFFGFDSRKRQNCLPCVHGVLVFAAALWGQMQTLEEKRPSCCEWLVCCPLGEEGDPTPHAYKPLCFVAARSHQVWTETEDMISISTDNPHAIIRLRVVADTLYLTRILFHNSNNTFFIGKWGAWPLQNLVTILKSMTEIGSLLKRGDPGLERESGES